MDRIFVHFFVDFFFSLFELTINPYSAHYFIQIYHCSHCCSKATHFENGKIGFVCIEIPNELFGEMKLITKAHIEYKVNGYSSIRIGFMEFES